MEKHTTTYGIQQRQCQEGNEAANAYIKKEKKFKSITLHLKG